MRKIIQLLLLTFMVKTAAAYPIAPQTLKKLVASGKYIIVATVDNPLQSKSYYYEETKLTESYTFDSDNFAVLHIKEVWKGNLGKATSLKVEYEPGMLCPAPPSYPDKKTVIAFLDKKGKTTTYFTVGLSYGSKIIESGEELQAYKKMIVEYLEILKMGDPKKKETATIEWLVKCTEDTFTRWNGIYDLTWDPEDVFTRDKDRTIYSDKLTAAQSARLEAVFFSGDITGFDELELAKFVEPCNFPKMKSRLLFSLSKVDFYQALFIMRTVTDYFPDKALEKIIGEAESLPYDENHETAIKQKMLIGQFIKAAEAVRANIS